ncbi:MAG: hypothetical protein PHI31_06485 [Desulfuromonadaceae bacterium]|nr:hypothetical protein [Desulfuromonadaceae bacterium]
MALLKWMKHAFLGIEVLLLEGDWKDVRIIIWALFRDRSKDQLVPTVYVSVKYDGDDNTIGFIVISNLGCVHEYGMVPAICFTRDEIMDGLADGFESAYKSALGRNYRLVRIAPDKELPEEYVRLKEDFFKHPYRYLDWKKKKDWFLNDMHWRIRSVKDWFMEMASI